jgi:hypothetical protein
MVLAEQSSYNMSLALWYLLSSRHFNWALQEFVQDCGIQRSSIVVTKAHCLYELLFVVHNRVISHSLRMNYFNSCNSELQYEVGQNHHHKRKFLIRVQRLLSSGINCCVGW